MSEGMEKIERTIQFILEMQAEAYAKAAVWREEEAVRRQEEAVRRQDEAVRRQEEAARHAAADREIKQIRRVLLSAIRLGRRERSSLNEKIAILIKGQIELQDAVKAFQARATNGSRPNSLLSGEAATNG